jgi:GR25 family glycosyltransferase involved in LPS biosynthesis
MKIEDIPKFIINLKRRPDRLESIKKQMDYVGWEFEVFDAVDTNSYMGCALSHLGILRIAKERGYKKVMIIEDDCFFMPYAKELIDDLNNVLPTLEYFYFNLSPTLNRHINLSEISNYILDMKNLPEKQNPIFREIYATNMVIYDSLIYDEVFKIEKTKVGNGDFYYAIDVFIFDNIINKYPSYCPHIPLCCQGNDHSDVGNVIYDTFYTQTYNWNSYSPCKIPTKFLNLTENKQKINNKIYETIC